jgi:hypothetical protein
MPSNVIALHNDEVMNMAGGAKRAKVRKSKPSKTKKTKVKKSKPSKTKKSKGSKKSKKSKGSKKSKSSKKSKGSKSMKGGKRKLPESILVRNTLLRDATTKLLGIKMSFGLNPFFTKLNIKSKAISNVGEDDKTKLYKEQFRLVKEYVDKHGKQKAIDEIKKFAEDIQKNKKPRGSKKKKKSKTKK